MSTTQAEHVNGTDCFEAIFWPVMIGLVAAFAQIVFIFAASLVVGLSEPQLGSMCILALIWVPIIAIPASLARVRRLRHGPKHRQDNRHVSTYGLTAFFL